MQNSDEEGKKRECYFVFCKRQMDTQLRRPATFYKDFFPLVVCYKISNKLSGEMGRQPRGEGGNQEQCLENGKREPIIGMKKKMRQPKNIKRASGRSSAAPTRRKGGKNLL